MKKIIIVFICFVFLSNFSSAQTFRLSFLTEGSLFHLKKLSDNVEYKSGTDIEFFSIYISLQDEISKEFTLELRPGLFLGGELFSGLEAGIYGRYTFLKKYFIFSGVSLHFNEGAGHGVTREVSTKDDTYTIIGIGAGVKTKLLNFSFTYNLPLENNFGYIAYEGKMYTTRLYGIYKLGIELYVL